MRDICDIISEGEGTNAEFKSILPKDSVKWVKTAVAFANGSGGVLVVGIGDDGTVIGVPDDSAFRIADSMVSAVCDTCTPSIPLSTSVQNLDGKSVVIMEVFPGSGRPYHIRDLGEDKGTFIRAGATSRTADPLMIHDLRLQGSNQAFDSMQNFDTEVTEERTRSICSGLSGMMGATVTESTLRNAGIIRTVGGHDIATNAYALLSDDSPFRFTEVRCAVFEGDGETDFADRADYPCPIYRQIDEAYGFVRRNLRLSGKVRGLYREDRCEIPLVAVREAIVNAVQHRSYVDSSRPVYVALYDDRLEVTSPGGLPSSLSVDLMRQGRSAHRNPSISMAFRAASISEGWGNSVRSIFGSCREYGLDDPVIEDGGIDVRVTIYRPGHIGKDAGSEIRDGMRSRILDALESNPESTVGDVSASTGIPRRTVERMISDMRRDGIIGRTGSSRSGRWIVVGRRRRGRRGSRSERER